MHIIGATDVFAEVAGRPRALLEHVPVRDRNPVLVLVGLRGIGVGKPLLNLNIEPFAFGPVVHDIPVDIVGHNDARHGRPVALDVRLACQGRVGYLFGLLEVGIMHPHAHAVFVNEARLDRHIQKANQGLLRHGRIIGVRGALRLGLVVRRLGGGLLLHFVWILGPQGIVGVRGIELSF